MALPLIVLTTTLLMCVLLSWMASAPDRTDKTTDDLPLQQLQRWDVAADRTGFVAPGALAITEFADDEDEQFNEEVTSDDERETA